MTVKRVAIIGAGPVGLAAAAHLAAAREEFVLLERGPSAGHAVSQWSHVRLFSPWRYNIDKVARDLLVSHGWEAPDAQHLPTGGELVSQYLLPLSKHPALRDRIRFNASVVSIGRKNMDKVRTVGREQRPFEIRIADGTSIEARAVIDTSGTWFSPNPMGSDGHFAAGETEHSKHIFYGIPDVLDRDRARYEGKNVLVVGAGHSATNVVLDLADLRTRAPQTQVQWAMRRENLATVFGGESADALPARGALGSGAREAIESGKVEVLTPFRISEIRTEGNALRVSGDLGGRPFSTVADEIVVAAGFRPDFSALREVRLRVDPWLEAADALAPLIDPNEHSCGTVRPHGYVELSHPEKDFFIAGMKSYGRAPTFLMATGYEQIRSIVAALTGDLEAAGRVELDLPQTGVCNTDRNRTPAADCGEGSCGTPEAARVAEPVRIPEPSAGCCG